MIGMSMTNASPLVSPTFSKERMLGTNPIAVAIPANEQPPFVGDFATTPAANGKLEVLMRKGENAPLGWIQDQGGQSTDNAHGIKEGGSWLPLGGDREHGSHKGFILGSIVDIFSAVLSGANYGPWAPPFVAFLEPSKNPVGEGLGHFFGAMRVDAFRPAEEFKSHMDNWITRFRESDRADENQPVVIPGDPERAYEKERSENGIPLLELVEKDLRALGERFGVKF
jgi:LDH2 family malate/lactate/ureidoglycolate dehydrogenase